VDKIDAASRSRVMSRNRASGTKTTERKFRSLLMRLGVRGWKLGHHSGLPGRPDFLFPESRVAIFLDGCFWHGCQRCRSIPASNRVFWETKIQGNRERDRKACRTLRAQGWNVVRIWEHDLKMDGGALLRKFLNNQLKKAGSRLATAPTRR
jgi:DNA mismatch endonuclease (patch repair protein)